MAWTSTTSSLKNLMRWRPVQIELRMDFSVRNSTCPVFQHFCLLHKCLRHHFVLFFTASLKRRHIRPLHRQSLSELMNGPIRQKLGVIPKNVTWGGNYSFYDLQKFFCVKRQQQLILTRVSTTCFFRTSWSCVCQHGRRFHEACGEHCGSAFGCRCQCHRLQWPAGSHRGHNGWGRLPLVNISEWQLLTNRC